MNNLVWFRNDLRVMDNASLTQACRGDKVLAVYCFDPRYFKRDEFGFKRTGRYRAQFLFESVVALREALDRLHIPLFVYQAAPETVIPTLVKEHGIQNIFLQREWTRDEEESLDAVIAATPALVNFEQSYDQFLFHPDDIPYESFQDIPKVFTQFRKKCESACPVRSVLPIPSPLPASNRTPNDTAIPTLESLGEQEFERDSRTAFPFVGGEREALKRIQDYFWETKRLAFYKKTRNGLVGVDYSSKLSPWLANGSVSARHIYHEVKRFEREVKKNQDTYWLVFELIWRDFFKYVSLKHGNDIFQLGGIQQGTSAWEESEKLLKQWISGQTQEPFVNANMLEIANTGWMSNRGRQNVASYWARTLGQDWRIGAAYFESLLLDYDVHSNWGNWMYVAGVGNDPRDRTFDVARQAEKYDGSGKFQRHWLQETLF